MLEMVIRTGAMSQAEVAKHTGLPSDGIATILARLVQLDYVSRNNGSRYKAEARQRVF